MDAERITAVTAAAYTIPTDAPEADDTLVRNSTTQVVAHARCGALVGTGWTYGSVACAGVVRDLLGDQVVGHGHAPEGSFCLQGKQREGAARVGRAGDDRRHAMTCA